MQKGWQGIFFLAILILFFGFGYIMADFLSDFPDANGEKKPVAEVKEKSSYITEDTQVIYEETYTKCGHVVISEFPERENLNGRSFDDIKLHYTALGYEIEIRDATLIIRHTNEGYCPAEYERRRLKEYKGYIAIYKGPVEEEVLEKVTSIKIENVPKEEQMKIKRGDYEFKDENALKDALENFDEYM